MFRGFRKEEGPAYWEKHPDPFGSADQNAVRGDGLILADSKEARLICRRQHHAGSIAR
jgi:hypothetical protein